MKKSFVLQLIFVLLVVSVRAWGVDMRRPISPTQPMWLVHIDGSYSQDALKTIDAIPADVLPYVVFNIAMTDATKYSYITDALEVCKNKGVWAMVQPSSGSRNSMSNTDIAEYEALYEKYPNLIGYNFCEQNWFETAEEFVPRLELFCKLMEIGCKYGGYLYVNDSQSLSNTTRNTIAKMKSYARYAECSKRYADYFIYGDKTTMGKGYYDNESACLGMYLSGHAGHYAIRFDNYAWSYSGHGQVFGPEVDGTYNATLAWFSSPEALMGISIVEHLMMQGATVIDGPEIPIVACLFDGQQTPSFKNMVCDIMRKVIDGTITIPSREEVLARTKMALAINSSAYTVIDDANIYDGLYQMDGSRDNNKTWLKRSGRYPSIPTVATAADAAAITSDYIELSGTNLYSNRWTDNDAKVAWFNEQYPEISTGDMYVARISNGIYAYNPYINTDQNAKANIPLQFNSCSSMDLEFTPHTFSVVKETANGLTVYLNNYRTDKDGYWTDGSTLSNMTQSTLQTTFLNPFIANPDDSKLRQSIIRVNGAVTRPTVKWKDRGDHKTSKVETTYEDGVWTLTVSHNGPLDISISCAGSGSGSSAPSPSVVDAIWQPTSKSIQNGEAFVYDFEQYAEDESYGTVAGSAKIATIGDSKALNPASNGTGTNKIGATILGSFGVQSDYSITWKEYSTGATKGGIMLRATLDNTGANPGVMSGYLFQTNTSISGGTTKMAIRKVVNASDGTTAIGNGSSGEKSVTAPASGAARLYRATANGSTLTFEYSDNNGTDWTTVLTRTDADYTSGLTQVLWGLNTNVTTSYYDDITLTPATPLEENESRSDFASSPDPEASVTWNSIENPDTPDTPEPPSTISVTIPSAGYTSFSSTYALDFSESDAEAYIVTSTGSDVVYLEQVTATPANTGLVLKAMAGSHDIKVASTEPVLTSTNLLKATNSEAYTVTGSDHIYILANKDLGIGFYPAATGLTIPTGYAYLSLLSGNARPVLRFNTETGVIGQFDNIQLDNFVYDLQGRKLSNSQLSNSPMKKGVYIRNGRKVIIR